MKTQRAGPKCCLGVVPQNSARMFSNPAPILRKPLVKELLQANNGRTVIELGAGCLRNALHLQELGFGVSVLEVVGMEERFPSQYRAFRRVGGRVLKTLPRLGRFDFSLATFVIETICNSQHRSELIVRVRRSLRPGGFLIMSVRGPRDLLTAHNTGVPCSDGYLTSNRTFSRSYTRLQLERFLLTCGFRRLHFLHKKRTKEPELLHVVAWK